MKLPATNNNVFQRQWMSQPAVVNAKAEPQRTEPVVRVSATAKLIREQNTSAQEALENFAPERTLSGVRKGQLVDIKV